MSRTRLVLSVAFVFVLVFLVVAPGAAEAAPAASPQTSNANWSACWYRVHWGDTLTRIAFHFHTSVRYLAVTNHIRHVDKIFAGMWLRVPCVATKFKSFSRY